MGLLLPDPPDERSEVSISSTQYKEGVKKMKTKQVEKGTIEPIKPFQTLDEEAAFWDTHSALDEINEGTVVGFHQANKTDTLTIRFSQEDIQRLREEAFEQGVGPSTLARMLVKKGLGRSSVLQ